MNKQDLLQQAIFVIAERAGIERPEFHLTSVSKDAAGVFIMQTAWPEGRGICNCIACAVDGFPRKPFTSCIPLLPELVDEIIRAANGENAGDGRRPVVMDSRHECDEPDTRQGAANAADRSLMA